MAYPSALSSYFIERVQTGNVTDPTAVLLEMCEMFGWEHATYLGTGLPRKKLGQDVIITTYRDDWVDRYNEQDYKYIDPIISRGCQSLLPLDWSDIRENSRELKRFFGEASELGVGRSGLTISVRGIQGDASLLSVNSSEEGATWERRKVKYVSELTYFAHLFHDMVLDLQSSDHECSQPKLTKREQDVLRWAAKGKTAWETSQILQLSEKTVSFYLSNASEKLNVATKTQAVATAITERLLIM